LHGRFVHVGKTLTDLQIWAVDCTKMRLAGREGGKRRVPLSEILNTPLLDGVATPS